MAPVPRSLAPAVFLVGSLLCAPGSSAAVALACSLVSSHALVAQTIRGTLRERASDLPIELGWVALVTVQGDTISSTLTTANGFFSVSSPIPGSYLLVASALGYRRTTAGVFDMGEGGEMTVEFRVAPEPVALEGLVVDVSDRVRESALILNGFYDRMQQGLGRFLTPQVIEKSQALRVTDLFYGIPRVAVFQDGGHERVFIQGPRGYCLPSIVLDGFMLQNEESAPDAAPPPTDLEAIASIRDVEAIEVFRGPSEIPLQYSGTHSGCGAILIWTKRR